MNEEWDLGVGEREGRGFDNNNNNDGKEKEKKNIEYFYHFLLYFYCIFPISATKTTEIEKEIEKEGIVLEDVGE